MQDKICELIALGNIRQISIKNIAIRLLENYPKEFIAGDFQHSKAKVADLIDVKSKLLRNSVTGHVNKTFIAS